MICEKQVVKARMVGDLLVPECLPAVANPLSGVYMRLHHSNNDNLTLVALRTNGDTGEIEGRVDGVFPYFVHPEFPARIGGAIPPVGGTPAYMLKTAVSKAMMYGEKWARDDGYGVGSYVVQIEPAVHKFIIDPIPTASQSKEWNFRLPDKIGVAWLYMMTDTPEGYTISRRKGAKSEKYFLPEEDRSFVATVGDAIKL